MLRFQYILLFFWQGCKHLYRYSRARRPVYLLILFAVAGNILIPFFASTDMVFPLVRLYRTVFDIYMLLILCIYIWIIGTPSGFLSISANMIRTGLSNSVGETPLLLTKSPISNHTRTEKWEFESRGVPFSAWENYAEKIESALDIAIIKIENGHDERKVLLTVVPHPGPWPQRIEWSSALLDSRPSVLILGENRNEKITLDLSMIPHILIAGRTGSGKSVLQKNLMLQCLLHGHQLILIDYKRGVDYTGRWHDFCTIVTDDDPLLYTLIELKEEMDRRLASLISSGVANIDEYNTTGSNKMQRICVFFDEVAECLDKTGSLKEKKNKLSMIENALSSLTRLGRAAGIHIILGTQRGSADILSGQIRNNVFKVCGSCDDNLSILTLGTADAARKIPSTAKGRFLTEDGIMFQGYYSDYPDSLFNFTVS